METPGLTKRNQQIYYWFILIVLIIFSLLGGIIGFRDYFEQNGEHASWIRSVYRSLQLFTLENGDLHEPIPWILHVVRFTAPLTAMIAIILAVVEIFRERLRNMRITRLKDHVIIIGLGTKGKNVLDENIRKREKILVLESDPLNPYLESVKRKRCHLILGDANNADILRKTRVDHAKSVYLLMGDDARQVKACLHIYKFIKDSHRDKGNPVKCVMHLQLESLNALKRHNLVEDINDGLDLNVFNVYENSARELFQSDPPDRRGLAKESKEFVQMIIFGFGQAGESLALHTAVTGHYLNRKIRLPRVILFDREAEKRKLEFLNRYPSFTDYCELEAVSMEANNPQLIASLVKYLREPDSLNTIVLCFDNKTNNMLLGFQIDKIKMKPTDDPIQIFIRTDDNEPLDGFSNKIRPYGLPSRVCSQEALSGGDHDKKAMFNHLVYLRVTESVSEVRSAKKEWEKLQQEFKDSNRKAADHIGVKIRGLGYMIVPEHHEPDGPDPYSEVTLSPDEIELLAQLEHDRWSAERSLAGWIYDPERNDDIRRTPKLVPWDELDEATKDQNRDSVKYIPDVLREVKERIVQFADNGK